MTSHYLLHWTIPSKTGEGRSHVVGLAFEGKLVCTCRNWKFRHKRPDYKPCDHIRQVIEKMAGTFPGSFH